MNLISGRLNKLVLVLALVLFARPGHANFVGNDTQNFNPTTSGLDFVTVESSETLSPGLLSSNLYFNQAKNSLPDSVDRNGQRIPSHDTITFGDLGFGYGINRRFDLGVGFSYLMNQSTDRNVPGAQFSATGLNEIRLGLKANLIKRAPFGLAFLTSVNINQTANNPFVGNSASPTLNFQGIADYRIGKVLVATNLGYRLRSSGSNIPDSVYSPLPSQFIGSLAANYYITSANMRVVGELYAAKPTTSVPYVDSRKISSEALLGVKYDALPSTALDAGVGTRTGDGLFTPDWRVYVGVSWNFDLQHKPIAAVSPEVPKEIRMRHVLGYLPRDIEALKDVPFDDITKTHEFQLRTTIPEKDIAGIKPPFEVIRLENFDFDTGSAELRPEYKAKLDKLSEYLASQPDVLKVRVEGHTDSLGSPDKNRALSERRSQTLRDYVHKSPGMENVLVETAGFGQDRPISDNGNFQGRRQNRRVEIRILRRIPEIPESVD